MCGGRPGCFAPATMISLSWHTFLKFRLLICSLCIFGITDWGNGQSIPTLSGAIHIRVSRSDGIPDTFINIKAACNSHLCAEPKLNSVDAPKESSSCLCQCPSAYPIFQDDISTCVQQIPESGGCPNSMLFDGRKQEINPVVQLPPFGQTINRKINLQLSDSAAEHQCNVEDVQFLSTDGWTSFSAIRLGSQPPRIKLVQQSFPQPPLPYVYVHDEPTPNPMIYNLQWLGSSEHAEFLQGRIILLTVRCNITNGLLPINLCFPMRIAGSFGRLRTLSLVDAAPPHQEGDHVETGILVAAACGGALGVLYVIVLAIFITSRLRKSRKSKQTDSGDQVTISGGNYDNAVSGDLEKNHHHQQQHPTDPLNIQFVSAGGGVEQNHHAEYNATSYAAWPEDLAFRHRLMQLRSRGPASLPIRYLYSPPPFFLNDVLIVQTPEVINKDAQLQNVIRTRLENKLLPKPPVRRRKLFFDPRYLDVDHLKHPTEEAVQFRSQIHCMINVTKSRLDKRRFLPNLEMIDEESGHGGQRSSTPEIRPVVRPAPHQVTQSFSGIQSAILAQNENTITVAACPPARLPLSLSSSSHGNCKNVAGKDLDCVVLQVHRPPSLPTPDTKAPNSTTLTSDLSPVIERKIQQQQEWSQVLKDEWGSNESLPKIPHRRRIQEVFQKNWGAISGSRLSLASLGKKSPDSASSLKQSSGKPTTTLVVMDIDETATIQPPQPTAKIKQPISSSSSVVIMSKLTGNNIVTPSKPASDDEDRESDKASSRSGSGSNPEKDSGIEDDVNSDKPSSSNKPSSHKLFIKNDHLSTGMISRKKIVSACNGGSGGGTGVSVVGSGTNTKNIKNRPNHGSLRDQAKIKSMF